MSFSHVHIQFIMVPSRMCQKDCNSDVLFITFIYLLIHLFSFEWV